MTEFMRGTALAALAADGPYALLRTILSPSFRAGSAAEEELRTCAFLEVLAETVEAKDAYMSGHGRRVAHYARRLAERAGLVGRDRERVRVGAFLHDLGKVGVPSELLLREGALAPHERLVLEQHPVIGARLVQPLGLDRDLTDAILHHHERWDGSGYPDRLAGCGIPYAARVVAIADAFDAMTSDRPYRSALPRHVALEELERNAGIQFDPELTRAFVALEDGDAGWREVAVGPDAPVRARPLRATA
jgi:putative nucleotidyltransferase with HDIG domain